MALAKELKSGTCAVFEGASYLVVDHRVAEEGRARRRIRLRLRDLRTGGVVERTLSEAAAVETRELEVRPHKYLHREGAGHAFLDESTFEKTTLPEDRLGTARCFLKEEAVFPIHFLGGEPVDLALPANLPLRIVETAPPARELAGQFWKEARLETDLVVKVPPFAAPGETIRVDTRTLEYVDKEGP